MIAALPMYDRPETRAANDALWQAVRDRLGYGPRHLTRDSDLWEIWQNPGLLLGQACGFPFRARLHGRVTLVVSPVHDLPDCPPGHYFSVLVARTDDPRSDARAFAGAVLAFNDPMSQSGWAAPQTHAQAQGFTFTTTARTGSHAAAARAVAQGRADIAALDVVSWTLMQRHDPVARGLRVVERTVPTPALPYITAPGNDAGAILEALSAAIAALPATTRSALCLSGVTRLPVQRYLDVPDPAPA